MSEFNRIHHIDESGELPAHAWPGGYPMYYVTHDSGVLCAGPECANGPESIQADVIFACDLQWLVVGADIHWEGEPLTCDHCGGEIESAYGIPEESEASK